MPRLLPCLSTLTLKTFRRIGNNGIHQSGRLACSRNRYLTRGPMPCCFVTLQLNVPVFDTVEDLGWNGPRPNFEEYCRQMKSPDLHARVRRKHQSVALKSD
jgi:hypothetical protein